MSGRDYVCPSLALLLGWDLQRQVLDGDRGQCFDPRMQDDCPADVVQPLGVCSGERCFPAGVGASDSPMSRGESGGRDSDSRSGGSGESSVSGVQIFHGRVAVHTPCPNPCATSCSRSTQSAARPARGVLSASTAASRMAARLVGCVVRFAVDDAASEEVDGQSFCKHLLLQASRALRERKCHAHVLDECCPALGLSFCGSPPLAAGQVGRDFDCHASTGGLPSSGQGS